MTDELFILRWVWKKRDKLLELAQTTLPRWQANGFTAPVSANDAVAYGLN